jgi:hypothetical protein
MEEVKRRLFAASPWKAPGDDSLKADLASGKREGTTVVPDITSRGHSTYSMEERKDYTTQKARKGNYTTANAWSIDNVML